ncbi:MAG: ATP-binding protein [Rhodocyclaceae bacterium]|nr:MAG: ATP-binding protein [Rhodocyclaceae bacterium]
MQIQVRINEEGALRNQRYAFSNRFTLLTELLQNARRAGATNIEITYDATTQILVVQDDGCGLDDFQKLLSFHESGWNLATSAEEHPFGVGFSKCLYAASRCIVTSGRQQVDIDTAAALVKASFEVESSPETVAGTRIELRSVDLPDLGNRMETLCLGFPVPVVFNGKPLARPLAAENLATMSSPMGSVYLVGVPDGRHSHATMVFLQGLCVKRSAGPIDRVNVVHLDSRQFMARLPDRDKLIDEDVQSKRIEAELKVCWRRMLGIAKTQLTAERFVEVYYPVMRAWGHLDLLNDIDALPTVLFENIVGYPIQEGNDSRDYVRQATKAPSRGAIESGAVKLVSLDWVNDDNAARWMLAQARGYLIFDWTGLQANHWVQGHVRLLEEEPTHVEAISEQVRVQLEGRWIWPTVILCEAVLVRAGNDVVEITDLGVCHKDVLYIPAGETSGEPVRQASSFIDEYDQFLESDLHADREALVELIRRLRSVDPVQTLDSLLRELGLGKYPLLRGKAFQVTVDAGSTLGHSVALIEEVVPASMGDHHAGS